MTDDLDALERLAIAYHKRTREPDGTGGEGEYGCPGATCPGVKRLVVFATACAEHASTSFLARLRAAEGRCILEVDSPSYPPSDSERRQCGCVVCLRDLLRAADQELMDAGIAGGQLDGESLRDVVLMLKRVVEPTRGRRRGQGRGDCVADT